MFSIPENHEVYTPTEHQEYIGHKYIKTYKGNCNDSSQYDNYLMVTLKKIYAFTPEKHEITAVSLDSYSICTKN